MKGHHLLMIGAAIVLIVLTSTGVVGGPLATLLLVGLLLLCPLMMLGMHGGSGQGHGGEHAPGEPERSGRPSEEVGRGGH